MKRVTDLRSYRRSYKVKASAEFASERFGNTTPLGLMKPVGVPKFAERMLVP